MSGATVPKSDPDAGGVLDADCRALDQLAHLGDDQWLALGDDPQFLLTWPEQLAAGPYHITLLMEADAAEPCIYLDLGEGWSERTNLPFERGSDGTRWTLLAWLPDGAPPARLDPTSRPGRFRFGGVVIERLRESDALLTSLVRRIEHDPGSAASVVQEAFQVAASRGFESCWISLTTPRPPAPAGSAGPLDYRQWLRQFDTLAPAQVEALLNTVARLPSRPLVSLVLRIGAASPDHLRACIDSVVAQLYPDWELLLISAAAPDAGTAQMLQACVERHSRIRLVESADDPSPGGSLGEALAGVQGRLVGFLDASLVLPRHSLLAFVDAVLRHPDAAVFYCDADRIDGSGCRSDPYFKPDWNPDLFLSQDYLNPLVLYDADLVRHRIGRREGASFPDIALRCVPEVGPSRIVHVPLLLCHARAGWDDQSGREARGRALKEHLGGADAGPDVVSNAWGHRILRPLPQPLPKVSLIVPTRDRLDLLRRCVDSICSLSTYADFELVIVDNQSSEPATLEYFANLRAPNVRVIPFDAPFNYSALNNHAVAEVDGEIVGLINNDIEVVSPDWLEQMVQHASRPEVGAVGAMLYYPDDTIQHAGVIVGLGGVAGHPYLRAARGEPGQMGRATLVQNLSAVTGACLLVSRSKYLEVGGLNERLSVAFNDIDFCLRLRNRGWRNVWTPFAELYHHESASRGVEDTPEKRARFHAEIDYMIETWGDSLLHDPAYHPSLSLLHDDAFRFAAAPRHSAAQWVGDFTGCRVLS